MKADILDAQSVEINLRFAANDELGQVGNWKLQMTTIEAQDWAMALSPISNEREVVRYR